MSLRAFGWLVETHDHALGPKVYSDHPSTVHYRRVVVENVAAGALPVTATAAAAAAAAAVVGAAVVKLLVGGDHSFPWASVVDRKSETFERVDLVAVQRHFEPDSELHQASPPLELLVAPFHFAWPPPV